MNQHLNWRYATKKFDPLKKIPEAEFQGLLDVLRLSPSSFGLQPWKFIVVKNEALRKKLQPHAWNQTQITEASHLIVMCSLKTMSEAYVKDFITQTAKIRGLARETLAGYEGLMLGFLKNLGPEEVSHWMKSQVYIALGMLMAECAHRRIDACPMEGFDHAKFDEILELDRLELETVVLCPVGYRAADDVSAGLAKVRFELKDVILEI